MRKASGEPSCDSGWRGALVRRYAARQPMSPPVFCTHREQNGSSSPPFVRSLPLTLALIQTRSQVLYTCPTPTRTTALRSDPVLSARWFPKVWTHCSPSNSLCAPSLQVLIEPRCGENHVRTRRPDVPSHLPYSPTTPRSAASCAHTHPTRTDHGSWVLVSA